MPYVSRRTMRLYRRLDQYLLKPLQFVSFAMLGLSVAYLLIGSAIIAIAGAP